MIVITSGYFDPLHVGHLECLEMAKKLGDKLFVIVNSKKQAIAKKGYEFMDEQDRKKIIKALKCVDMAIISIDRDASVCETIRAIAKANLGDDFIFAKGGDRKAGELLEDGVCAEYGIKVVSGLGEKIRSSSEMVKNAKEKSD